MLRGDLDTMGGWGLGVQIGKSRVKEVVLIYLLCCGYKGAAFWD